MKATNFQSRKMAVILLLTYLCQSFSSNMLAQQIGINPVMKVSNLNKGTENPMRLDILNIDIKIIGQTAVTTMDMTYYNDNSRLMEGEFNFPLADGQSVSRFAL